MVREESTQNQKKSHQYFNKRSYLFSVSTILRGFYTLWRAHIISHNIQVYKYTTSKKIIIKRYTLVNINIGILLSLCFLFLQCSINCLLVFIAVV